MDLRLLRYFLAASQHKSLRQAAESLNISQPALSKSIRMLEEQLQVVLFDRSKRGVELTYFGRALSENAKLIELECRQAANRLRALRGADDGQVLVGAAKSACGRIMPMAVARLLNKRPRLRVNLSEGRQDDLLAQLVKGELDLVLCALAAQENNDDLVQEYLYIDEVRVLCRRDHPLARRKKVVPADLCPYSWILPAVAPPRVRLNEIFLRHGLPPPTVVCESDSLRFVHGVLLSSDLLSFFSSQMFSSDILDQGLRPLDLSPPYWDRAMGLSWRRRGFLTPATQALVDELRAVCRDHAAPPYGPPAGDSRQPAEGPVSA